MPFLYETYAPKRLGKGEHLVILKFAPEGKAVLVEARVTNKRTGITYYTYPEGEIPEAAGGDQLRIVTTWRNEGTNGDMFATIKDDVGTVLADWQGFVLSWYVYTCTADPVTVPNREYKITCIGGHIV